MPRQAKSIEEHKANGTYRPSRHDNRGMKIEPVEMLTAPEFLSEKAKQTWNDIIFPLIEAGSISIVDKSILTDAFINYDNAIECLDYIRGSGSIPTYLKTLNKIKDCNLWEEYNKSMNKFNKIMMKFGVTPAERARIKLDTKKSQESTTDELFHDLMKNGG